MLLFRLIHIIVIFLAIKHLCCQRRIIKGRKMDKFKSYLVYLVHSEQSPNKYDEWTCAGALVHSLFIVTAAACLEDVHNLYAMAGYAKLVLYENMKINPCVMNNLTRRLKVISTCIPRAYELDYSKVEKWSAIDIGVAKVETKFKQYDEYLKVCTHKPLRIPINYNTGYQSPGINAIVMGWGHTKLWRKPGDKTKYNREYARYASVRIIDKKKCKEYYNDFPELQKSIDKYMICTMDKGDVNDVGVVSTTHRDLLEECTGDSENCRRKLNENSYWNISSVNTTYDLNGRRQGFCQNDHGAPLVTWIGGTEHLIGVASVFRVDEKGKCAGPYLFTSTHCNGLFLNCVLEEHLYKGRKNRRNSACNLPVKERGFEMIYKHINWNNRTDLRRKTTKVQRHRLTRTEHNIPTTTKNTRHHEKVQMRPQISISNFNQ